MINDKKVILFLLFLFIIAIPTSFANEDITGVSADTNLNEDITGVPADTNLNEDITGVSADLNEGIADKVGVSDLDSSNEGILAYDGDDNVLGAGEVYFDASASSDGSGTQSSPYKYLYSSRVGTVNHFAPGTYSVSSSISSMFSSSSMTFIGSSRDTTIIEFIGSGTFLESGSGISFDTITLKKINIKTSGSINATNTVFDSGTAEVEDEDGYKFDNSYGGAVKISGSASSFMDELFNLWGGNSSGQILFENCIFKNNYAAYGGALYINSSKVTIRNSRFISNHAANGGGAISAINCANLTISGCSFEGDYAIYDAGGSIYLYNSTATISNSNFTACQAGLGSAIGSIKSNLTINGIYALNNNASFEGGAVYSMFGNLEISNSNFTQNRAQFGGAVFTDDLSSFKLTNSRFTSNEAVYQGGGVVAYSNALNTISGISYNSNIAIKNENYYETDILDIFIGSEDYNMVQYNPLYNGTLPSKFDLRTYDAVTSLKEQANSGNCWAFATISTLESAIKKATGIEYDLSEGNLKNLAQLYSDFGWPYETNQGGLFPMALSVLLSWASPVLESRDPTDDWDLISPLLNSDFHIQNILFLNRRSYTDNDAIKKAIMDYGAVATQICMQFSSSYMNSNTGAYYYYGNESTNHAITIIGWDDSYSASNFVRQPAGNGAWIVKNSYGTRWGNSGYGYVSYYDTRFASLNDQEYTYAFILNDTIRFNKNYQYDVCGKTDYFITGADTLYYKNIFTSTGNDLLSAFSTYFNSTTDWQAEIIVNGVSILNQTGHSVPGYFTINLNQQIPLKVGDVFEISLKVHSSGITSFPISEKVAISKAYYTAGVSFMSHDGINWIDLFDYEYEYEPNQDYGHVYSSQVACIKAFTSQGEIDSSSTVTDIVSANSTAVVISVKGLNGVNVDGGNLSIIIDGIQYNKTVSNGIATLNVYLTPGNHTIIAEYFGNDVYTGSSKTKVITIDKEDLILEINASDISYGGDLNIVLTLSNGKGETVNLPVILVLNNKTYFVNNKKLTVPNLAPGSYLIKASVGATDTYNAINASKTISVSKLNSTLKLEIPDVLVGQNIQIKAIIEDVESGQVFIKLKNVNYMVNIIDGEGSISIPNSFDKGQYDVKATFIGNDFYKGCSVESKLNVVTKLIDVNISADEISEGQIAYIEVNLPDDLEGMISLSIDSRTYEDTPTEGKVRFNVSGLSAGNHSFFVLFDGDDSYSPFNKSGVIRVNNAPEISIVFNETVRYFNGDDLVIFIENGRGKNVLINVNNILYSKTADENGFVYLSIKGLSVGNYNIRLSAGNITASSTLTILSTINASNMTIAYGSDDCFKAYLYDSDGGFLDNKEILLSIDEDAQLIKTDSSGLLSLSNNLSSGTHEICIYNLETGENLTISLLVFNKIVENRNITMDYNDGSIYRIRLFSDNGKLASEGETVTLKIYGKTYHVETDKYGYASFKIDLKPGSYTIKANYDDVNISNTIKVKSILSAPLIYQNKTDEIKYSATLKFSNGNPIAGEQIRFEVGNETYYATTNRFGVATISLLNYDVGIYYATISYLENSILRMFVIN